jgi:hypothetical protein
MKLSHKLEEIRRRVPRTRGFDELRSLLIKSKDEVTIIRLDWIRDWNVSYRAIVTGRIISSRHTDSKIAIPFRTWEVS